MLKSNIFWSIAMLFKKNKIIFCFSLLFLSSVIEYTCKSVVDN